MALTRTCLIAAVMMAGSAAAWAEIPRFAVVTPQIYRGGQPESAADYDALRALGVRTILNLRRDDSVAAERGQAARLGMAFETAGIHPYEYPTDGLMERALNVLRDPMAAPVFVHCQLGKDRTGLVIGLYRVHEQDWDRREAYEEMKSFGYNPVLAGLTAYFWLGNPFTNDHLAMR